LAPTRAGAILPDAPRLFDRVRDTEERPVFTPLSADRRIERPGYVWLAIALEVFTALGAIPVGIMLLTDTTGAAAGFPRGWIEATPFGSYLVPGLYLFAMNGVGMVVLAALSVQRHRWAPWLTAILGTGLIVWIGVQLVVMPETSFLQVVFGVTGLVLLAVGVAWLRRVGQLRLR
jgi:hypothetical protein